MATWLELRNYVADRDSDMHNKTEMAVAVVIADILAKTDTAANGYDDNADNHASRRKWAANALARVRDEAASLTWVIMCAMKDMTKAQIDGAAVTALIGYLKPYITEYAVERAA